MTSHCFGLILNELNLFALQLMETDLFFLSFNVSYCRLKKKRNIRKQTNKPNEPKEKKKFLKPKQNKVTTTSAATTKINWKKNNMKIIENKEE